MCVLWQRLTSSFYILILKAFLLIHWEFHTMYFEHTPCFPNLTHNFYPLLPSNPALKFLFIDPHWVWFVLSDEHLRDGACPGMWMAYRGHIFKENWLPLSWKLPNVSSSVNSNGISCPPPLCTLGFCLAWVCAGFMYTVTAAMSEHGHLPCCV